MLSVVLSCIISTYCSIYFEKKVKTSNIWAINYHLALFSVIFSFLNMISFDHQKIKEDGIFQGKLSLFIVCLSYLGYDILVLMLILVGSVNGFAIALVMKYADNILKCFANTISIIIVLLLSIIKDNFKPNFLFYFGSCIPS